MCSIDNPVLRLKQVIESLLAANTKVLKEKKSATLKNVLIKAFEDDIDGFPEALHRWTLICALSERARERIEKLNGTESFHYKPFESIDVVLRTSNFDVQFSSLQPYLVGETSVALNFCVDLVKRDNNDNEVDLSELSDIKKDVEDLMNKVPSYDIHDDIKVFVMNQLSVIHKVLHNYRLFGIEGIEDVFEKALGSITRKHYTSEEFKESEVKSEMWGILNKMNIFIGLCTATPLMIENISRALGN